MIPDPGTYAVFAAAALALAVVPGPAVLYIVAQSVPGGRRAGVVSALGIATGGLFHIATAEPIAIPIRSRLIKGSTEVEAPRLALAARVAATRINTTVMMLARTHQMTHF